MTQIVHGGDPLLRACWRASWSTSFFRKPREPADAEDSVTVPVGGDRREHADQLYRRFGAIVYRRALVLLGSEGAAVRATPAVFAILLRRSERFDDPDALRWIIQMTTRHCLALTRD